MILRFPREKFKANQFKYLEIICEFKAEVDMGC
jgi:hypothetical protein